MDSIPRNDRSGTRGGPPDPPRRIRRLCARLLADDLHWFKTHPNATQRVRRYHPGEDWPDTHTGKHVLVRRDGHLIHYRYFNAPTRTTDDWLILYKSSTGEVIGKYSEGVA